MTHDQINAFLDSLDSLQFMVEQMFGNIPNTNATIPRWEGSPLLPEQLGTIIRVKTLKSTEYIQLTWYLPNYQEQTNTEVLAYDPSWPIFFVVGCGVFGVFDGR